MRQTIIVLLLSSTLWAQATGAQSTALTPEPQTQTSAPPGADLVQMRNDLNQMESLLDNMSTEIEFLHDQNLQILLRTNARLWTILIRDLRQQIARAEQDRGRNPAEGGAMPKPTPR
jgi:TolA-binding protein